MLKLSCGVQFSTNIKPIRLSSRLPCSGAIGTVTSFDPTSGYLLSTQVVIQNGSRIIYPETRVLRPIIRAGNVLSKTDSCQGNLTLALS